MGQLLPCTGSIPSAPPRRALYSIRHLQRPDHPSTFVSDVRSLKSACMDVGYNVRLPGRSALWLFKHWTFYQISPFSHSYPDQAETLHLIPCGAPQFFYAHMYFLAVAYRTKFKPCFFLHFAPACQPSVGGSRCHRKIGGHHTKSAAQFHLDRSNYVRRG